MPVRATTLRLYVAAAGVAALAAFAMPAAALAHSYTVGKVAIGHVWAPPSDGTSGVPVYGPLLNSGSEAVTLQGLSSVVAGTADIRGKGDEASSAKTTLQLQPGKPVSLAAWRDHIYLSDLDQTLKAGDEFDLTLDFGEAGKVTVTVMVEEKPDH